MVLCGCSNVAIIKTSWTDRDPGRWFFYCPNVGSECGTFGWIDPPMGKRAIKIIPSLLRARNALEEDIEEYVEMYREQQELMVIDLLGAKMESLLKIILEEANCYHRMSIFMMKVLKGVTWNDRNLVSEVSSSISCTHWSLCDLADLVVDPDCNINKEHVSGVIQDYRSKIINKLNQLYDYLSTDSSTTTTKQMIKDYIVAFEGGLEHEEPADDDLAKKLHQSEDLQMMILLNYAPIKKKSSTIISKKSDDEMITNKRKFEGQLCSSRSLREPKYTYQEVEDEDEDDLDTWDFGAGIMEANWGMKFQNDSY
ncbi:zinc finger, GRF-type [Artemisia annua]|uniref:Zinc finger, GRF-type n=1 Tax=Artemisia annua TaxID=35608 RepID=A0A2U1MWM8_ARTAN|nr:zinc finger, GRF-type [Artemisia annua]